MISAAEARKKSDVLATQAGSAVSKRRQELDALVAREMEHIEKVIVLAVKEDEKSVHIKDAYGASVRVYGWMQRFKHCPPPTGSDRDYSDNLGIDALTIILAKLLVKGFKCESDFVNTSHFDQCLKISW